MRPPWWVPYLFLGIYALALVYGCFVVGNVSTADFFTQFSLLLASAFGIQIEPKPRKGGNVDIEAENVDVNER